MSVDRVSSIRPSRRLGATQPVAPVRRPPRVGEEDNGRDGRRRQHDEDRDDHPGEPDAAGHIDILV